ncbi:unnamed protein product [Sphagnum troendelagicum]|uniref:ATP synthase F0 subunit 8 n=1 Tax=Sphagnum troendelagicum TaxID=128251 RepID=A0ABP0UAV4_9BRYO
MFSAVVASFFVVTIIFSVAWCAVKSCSEPSSFPPSVLNAQMQLRSFIFRRMVWGFQSDVTSTVLVFSAGVHSELDSGREAIIDKTQMSDIERGHGLVTPTL